MASKNELMKCGITGSSSVMFTRTNIESLKDSIKLMDTDETYGLDLFCYVNCNDTDSDIIKKCRGTVFHNDKIVFNSFPYTHEYTFGNHDDEIYTNILNHYNPTERKYRFFTSYEGCIIRIFWFKDKWFVGTNKKFNAYRSKWASKESYGVSFEKALIQLVKNNETFRSFTTTTTTDDNLEEYSEGIFLNKFTSALNPNLQYVFLLLNNEENRIVCDPPSKPTVFHVGTFNNGLLDIDYSIPGFPKPEEHTFTDTSDIQDIVDNLNYKKNQGLIVFAPNNVQYKIYNDTYYEYYKVRGNEASIKFRFLKVRLNKKYNELLHELYPSYKSHFSDYETCLGDIAKDIHTSYLNRFIKKNYVSVPQEQYHVIRQCHEWYKEDRNNNIVTLNKVIDILNIQPVTNLNKMIKALKYSKIIKSKEELLLQQSDIV